MTPPLGFHMLSPTRVYAAGEERAERPPSPQHGTPHRRHRLQLLPLGDNLAFGGFTAANLGGIWAENPPRIWHDLAHGDMALCSSVVMRGVSVFHFI